VRAVLYTPASVIDARAIAALHAESWRDAYRGLVPDDYLAGPVLGERLRFWETRMSVPDQTRWVLKAMDGDELVGFTCVLRDADPAWGPLLDNLHVKPARRGHGIGLDLFNASRDWSATVAPGAPMHLWVIEDNHLARRFYDRQQGQITGREVVELAPGIHVPALRYVWKARHRPS
jgi:GNAT superfamily N-acetyltransferase